MKPYFLRIAVFCILLIGCISVTINAQSDLILTISVSNIDRDRLDATVFDNFEAQFLGVQVMMVDPGSSAIFPDIYDNLDDHLNGAATYASLADVFPLSSWQLSNVMTRAGYLLDLSPLIDSDTTFDISTYYPSIWNATQWDGGTWGLPVSADLLLFDYLPSAFDAAGLPYPDSSWTLDDIPNAARALSMRDASGAIITPGFWVASEAAFFRALLGHGFYDPSILPNPVDLSDPTLETLLTQWTALINEGVVAETGAVDPNSVPFRVTSVAVTNQDASRMSAPLSGNSGGLLVDVYAVSGGTSQPELAYELAKYISTNPAFTALSFNPIPAQYGTINLRPELQAVTEIALQNAFGYGEIRNFYGVAQAIDTMLSTGINVDQALLQAQEQIRNDLQIAQEHAAQPLIVETKLPSDLNSGEIALNFGVLTSIVPLPNEAQWQTLIDDFVANDNEVAHISLNANAILSSDMAAQTDCFYSPGNPVESLYSGAVLSLDPYLDADPNFNPSEIIGGAIQQLQHENQTWGLPVGISPAVMWYDANRFSAQGLTPEGVTWTINQFDATLRSLDNPALLPMELGNTPYLMLAAAYGGLPIDYRTSPPTLNFTDPNAISALQQVLDLAKDGHIAYRSLNQISMGGGSPADPNTVPMTTDRLSPNSFRLMQRNGAFNRNPQTDTYEIVAYPDGVYTPVSYDLNTTFISATTPYRDACYRWMSYLADHPEAFSLMPISADILENPAYQATQTERMLDFYRQFSELTTRDNAVIFPRTFGTGIGEALPMIWLNRAIDNYVQNGADLATELAAAQDYTSTYQACFQTISTQDNREVFNQQVSNCVATIDPSLANGS